MQPKARGGDEISAFCPSAGPGISVQAVDRLKNLQLQDSLYRSGTRASCCTCNLWVLMVGLEIPP